MSNDLLAGLVDQRPQRIRAGNRDHLLAGSQQVEILLVVQQSGGHVRSQLGLRLHQCAPHHARDGCAERGAHALTDREVLVRTTSVICCTYGNMASGLACTTAVREKRYTALAPSSGTPMTTGARDAW